jgi:hypothetical protein
MQLSCSNLHFDKVICSFFARPKLFFYFDFVELGVEKHPADKSLLINPSVLFAQKESNKEPNPASAG